MIGEVLIGEKEVLGRVREVLWEEGRVLEGVVLSG